MSENEELVTIPQVGDYPETFESPLSTALFSYESYINPNLAILQKNEALDILSSPSYFKKAADNPVLGRLQGTYFVPNESSRNKRFYPLELWQNQLANEDTNRRIKAGMLGMFEHPKSTDYYTKEGLITGAHPIYVGLVTNSLRLESVDDKVYGIGTGYVVDTPVGRILDVLLRSRNENNQPIVNLYMSSRSWGKYTGKDTFGNSIMHPRLYYLATFDVVTSPGFLQASPQYVQFKESVDSRSCVLPPNQANEAGDIVSEIVGDLLRICEGSSCRVYKFSKVLEGYNPKSKLLSSLLDK